MKSPTRTDIDYHTSMNGLINYKISSVLEDGSDIVISLIEGENEDIRKTLV